MNEKTNSPVKWLQYLFNMSIAALAVSLLSYIPGLGTLTRWAGRILNLVTIYLLFQLREANPRYKNSAIFSAVSLVGVWIGGTIPALAGSVCGIVAQYQEYHGHGELVADRAPRLAGKWHTLFWLNFWAGLLVGVLLSLVMVVLTMAMGVEATENTTLITVATGIFSLILKGLYLLYLHRTMKALETEIVM